MVITRFRAIAGACSAVAGIVAGILGAWLAGRWSWGIAAGFLILIAVVAGAEIVKAYIEKRDSDRDGGQAGPIASMTVGDHAKVAGAIVAGGDVDQSHTTNIRRGLPIPVAVLVCAIALLGASGGTAYLGTVGGPPGPSPSPGPTASSVHHKSSAGSPGCTPPGSGQSVPDSTPPGVRWTLFQSTWIPWSRLDGPAVVNGDIARCYAHTPVGALIAGAQISARLATASNWQAIAAQQIVPGPGRDKLWAVTASATASPQPGQCCGRFAGFKFITYTPQAAVIDYVTSFSEGLQATTTTVDWSGGDWKLLLQPSDVGVSTSPDVRPVPSLAGYVIWGSAG